MGIRVRTLTMEDVDVSVTILSEAYNALPAMMRDNLTRYLALQPDGWMLALIDDVPVGVGGAIDYGTFSYIGLVAVHPAAQRQGIGIAVMKSILAWLEQRGCPVVLLEASTAGAPLYERLGFTDDDTTSIFRRNGDGGHWFSMAKVFPLGIADLPELSAFDATIFGAERKMVFTSYLADFPQRAFATRNMKGQITGYLFALSTSIGPWAALDVKDAETLLAHALTLPFALSPGVFVPTLNRQAEPLLKQYGFSQGRVLRHMRLGNRTSPVRRSSFYGLASLAIG